MRIFLVLFLILNLYSCSNKIDQTKSIEGIVQDINQPSAITAPTSHSFIKKDAVSFLNGICDYINSDEIANPFIIGKYFTERAFREQSQNFSKLAKTVDCISAETIISDQPLHVVKLNIKNEHFPLYFIFELNNESIIKGVYSFFDIRVNISHQMIEMRDGTKISSYFIGDNRFQQKTALIKTPYLHTSGLTPFKYYPFFLQYNVNMLIQANRGTHSSEGEFKWLDEVNITDGEDTVNWITSQDFSNGEVIPWGISYDGFNALATASSNAKGIIGTIACSAPANASTDSFSANRTVAKQLLRYIWIRENSEDLNHFESKFNYLIQSGFNDFANLDQALFNRKIADWQELFQSINSRSTTYWENRNLIPSLKKTSSPVLHIAGLKNDQDSRDTLLTYFALKQSPMHKLYLHKDGHGCGDFFHNATFAKFIFGKAEHVEKNTIYSINAVQNYTYPQDYNGSISAHKVFKFSPKRSIFDNYTHHANYPHSIKMSKTIEEDIVINGMPILNFNVLNKSFKSFMTVSAWIVRPDRSTFKLHSMSYDSIRTGHFFDEETLNQYVSGKITLYPSVHRVSKGSKIVLKLSTRLFHNIDFFMHQREEFYSQNGDGSIEFPAAENSIQLLLPVE